MGADELLKRFAQGTNNLLDHGIQLMLWGEQLHLIWGYPAVVSVFDFVVEDSRLEEAVNLLKNSDTGFKLIDPSIGARIQGALGVNGYHLINQSDEKQFPSQIHLIPESLVHLSAKHAVPVNSPFDSTREFCRSTLPRLCISLIKCMEDYPAFSAERYAAQRYLNVILTAAVYKSTNLGGKIYIPEEETESEEDFKARQNVVIKDIEGWELSEEDEPYRPTFIKFLIRNTID